MMKSEVYAKHMFAIISFKKVMPVMDMIRGKTLHDAKLVLAFDRTKASKLALKVLRSAEANALHNNKLDTKNLYVSEAFVSPGPMVKSGEFKGRGRFSRILKRRSHLYIGLSTIPSAKKKVTAKKSPKKQVAPKKEKEVKKSAKNVSKEPKKQEQGGKK